MKKRKSFLPLFFVVCILLICTAFSLQAYAAEQGDILSLTEVSGYDTSKDLTIEQWGSRKNVYILNYSFGDASIKTLTFSGTLIDETAKLKEVTTSGTEDSASQKQIGTISDIQQDGKNYSFVYNVTNSANSAKIIYATVTYQNQDYDYIFAFVPAAKVGYDFLIKNAITGEIPEDGYAYQSQSTTLKTLTMDANEVAIECLRESNKPETYNSAKVWLRDGEIYVRVNGGEYSRMDASGDRLGENWSKNLPLKSGLNVIEVVLEKIDTRIYNSKKGSIMKEGFTNRGVSFDSRMVYIIENTGKGTSEITKSSDTSLKKVEATQLAESDSLIQYGVGTDEETGNLYIALPEQLPTTSTGTVYNKIILGLIPTDPNAAVEIVDEDEANPVVCGDTVGMYNAVKVATSDGTLRDKIQVKVTASDGTAEIHDILLKYVSSDCTVNNITFANAVLKDITSKESVSFNADTMVYALQPSGAVTAKVEAAEGTKVLVNGKKMTPDAENQYAIAVSDMVTIIKVVAADGISSNSYYFVTEDSEGNIPLFGQTQTTKDKANWMLTGWYSRSEEEVKNMEYSDDDYVGAWAVYQNRATNVDISGGTAYDVTTSDYNQGTDWARAILELIMIGENPYNYNGTDYVAGLKACGGQGNYGPFACNIWALMAFKAVGEQPSDYTALLNSVKSQASNTTFDPDMRAWAIAAISDLVDIQELLPIALSLKDTQKENGLWGNSYTNGCQLTAIAASGINIEYFNTADTTVLEAYAEKYLSDSFKFIFGGISADSYQKDAIIGLGDIVNERSIWASYKLTNEKVKTLITAAKSLSTANASYNEKSALVHAIEALEAVQDDESGYGDEYYALYAAMAAISDEYNEHIKLCTWDEGVRIDTLIADITENCDVDTLTIQSGEKLTEIQESYNAVGGEDAARAERLKAYVTNAKDLTAAEEAFTKLEDTYIADLNTKIESLGDVDKLTLDKKAAVAEIQAAYQLLNDKQKERITNNIVAAAAEKISALEVSAVEDLIKNLPENGKLTVSDEKAVNEAKKAYEALSADLQVKVSAADTLTKAVDKIAALKVEETINKLGKNPSASAVQAARKAYEALSAEQKKLLDSKIYKDLQNAEANLAVVKVTGVKLNHTACSLLKGKTAQLTATVSPANATNKTLTFTSSNTKVATVNAKGKITAKKEGTATITVTTKDSSKKATCKVTVTKKLGAKVSAQTASSVTLKWTKVNGSKGYKVYQYNSKTKKYKLVKTVASSKTSYKVSKLTSGTAYKFKVVSYYTDSNKSVNSQSETLSTATKPAKVTVKSGNKTSAAKAKLTWKKVKGSSGYQVVMSTSKKGTYKSVKTISGAGKLTYTKSSLKKGKTYYFKVRAYKTVNGKKIYGAYSKIIKVKM